MELQKTCPEMGLLGCPRVAVYAHAVNISRLVIPMNTRCVGQGYRIVSVEPVTMDLNEIGLDCFQMSAVRSSGGFF
jgi:hypothetical protein